MAEKKNTPDVPPKDDFHEDEIHDVDLRNRWLAGVLTWLVPGLGQWYQGRRAKAVLFFISIFGSFAYGCYIGSDPEYGFARVVYHSMREGDRHYYFFPQACIGVGAIPALAQSSRVAAGNPPLWGGFMAPPALNPADTNAPLPDDERLRHPTLHELQSRMPARFQMGRTYTVIAGLLNLLAIFDALEGPVFIGRRRKLEQEDDTEDEPAEDASAES